MQMLTKQQAAVIGAFTGICCGPFEDIHEYAETKLGRSIWTHDFGYPELSKKLKLAAKEDFIALCRKEIG